MKIASVAERTDARSTSSATMKALVFHGPGRRSWEDKPRPRIQAPTDALVEVTAATICGTDLHILKGDVPEVCDGRILGHEAVGIVREAGTGVFAFRPGDRVLVSCITSCGRCDYCRRSMYSHCRAGGWMLGHTIDGAQAEFVRIPHADTSLHRLPDEVGDDAALMLSDVLPTAFECGVLDGRIQPGDQVAIVGAGPIGLATVLTARFFSPSRIVVVDTDPHRLRVARSLGATHTVDAAQGCAAEEVLAISGGEGVDVAIEAVGVPETFDLCQSVVAPGGRIANIGVHGKPVRLRLDRLWSHNIGITTRLVDTACTPRLLKLVASGQLLPAELATHHFRMSETMRAYDTFASAPRERALKVILEKD